MDWIENLPGNIKLMTVSSISGWFVMSVSLSNINKWIFQHYTFHYPLFLTTIHMLSTYFFCLFFFKFTSMGQALRREDRPNSSKFSNTILVLSLIFTISISCGNIATKLLYISFTKMIFAMTPLATVLLSKLISNRRFDIITYISVVPICFGCVMCTAGEVNFNLVGFFAASIATCLRALRSILQGILLKEERIDSLELLYRLSVPSCIILAIATFFFESSLWTDKDLLHTPSLWVCIFLSSSCAVGYNIMTFLVTFYTSPVTLQILGNVSMILTVLLSILIFKNEVSLISVGGIGSVIVGTLLYQESERISKLMKEYNIWPYKVHTS